MSIWRRGGGNPRERLPESHLACVVSDLVDQADLTSLGPPSAGDQAPLPIRCPILMVRVLVYAYITGVFSSRTIQHYLATDPAFEQLAEGNTADFGTIVAFRRENLLALKAVLTEVLNLAGRAGATRLGQVSLDQAGDLLAQAEAADLREDTGWGFAATSGMPAEFCRRESRLKLIEAARREVAQGAWVHNRGAASAPENSADRTLGDAIHTRGCVDSSVQDRPVGPESPKTRAANGTQVSTRQIHVHRAWVLVLWGSLVLLELLPLPLAVLYKKLWFLSNMEDFTWSFWPPLKPQLALSYFYHNSSFLYWLSLRGVHSLTAVLLQSKQATVEYMQLFGYLTKMLYSFLTIAIATSVLCSRRFSSLGKIFIFLLMIFLIVGTADFFWLYHMRVSINLSYKLILTVAFIAIILQLDQILDNRSVSRGWLLLCAAFCGVVFFEMPLYSYIGMFFVGMIFISTPRDTALSILWKMALVAGASAGMLLLLFYEGDVGSVVAAVRSHILGLVHGLPQGQPDFEEHFVRRALSLESRYFLQQIFLVLGIGTALVVLVWYGAGRRWRDRRRRDLVPLGLTLIYLLALAAHFNVWRTRGSYTTVFSGVFLTGLYLLLVVYALVRERQTSESLALRGMVMMVTVVVAVAGPLYNCDVFGNNRFTELGPKSIRDSLRSQERLFRSVLMYDEFIKEFDGHYTIDDNASLYFNSNIVGWQYRGSELFHHIGAEGSDLLDLRYGGMFQRERHPRYSFYSPSVVVEVTSRLGSLQVGTEGRRLESAAGTVIVPLRAEVGAAIVRGLGEKGRFVAYGAVRGRAREALLAGYPALGVFEFVTGESLKEMEEALTEFPLGRRGWVVLPLEAQGAGSAVPDEARGLLEAGYTPFLGVVSGQYHLLFTKR